MMQEPTVQFNFRIPLRLRDRLNQTITRTSDNPYPPTITQVVVRGIELALSELQNKRSERK